VGADGMSVDQRVERLPVGGEYGVAVAIDAVLT
jgi:hypothetical protein